MSTARDERLALCDLLDSVGPDAPTLCEGWKAKDLAAHLVLRERRPDAAAGIVLRSLAGYTKRVQDELANQPFPQLVDTVRQGPPAWSPQRLDAVDRLSNTVEMVIHHEDVRRAQPGWEPRPAEKTRDDEVWERLRATGRLALRKSPVGVRLQVPDRAPVTVRPGPRPVTLVGPPVELALYVSGRRDVARVKVEGEPADVQAFERTSLGL